MSAALTPTWTASAVPTEEESMTGNHHEATGAEPPEDTVQPEDVVQPGDAERGDVPGWVLVTLMTAGLVIALWAVAGPALVKVFETAIAQVTGSHP